MLKDIVILCPDNTGKRELLCRIKDYRPGIVIHDQLHTRIIVENALKTAAAKPQNHAPFDLHGLRVADFFYI